MSTAGPRKTRIWNGIEPRFRMRSEELNRSADYTDYADFGLRLNLLVNNKLILGRRIPFLSRTAAAPQNELCVIRLRKATRLSSPNVLRRDRFCNLGFFRFFSFPLVPALRDVPRFIYHQDTENKERELLLILLYKFLLTLCPPCLCGEYPLLPSLLRLVPGVQILLHEISSSLSRQIPVHQLP